LCSLSAFVCVECRAMFDIVQTTDKLKAVKPDCDWLMLVDGQHKLINHDFANAAKLLEGGTCGILLCPLLHIHKYTLQTFCLVICLW